MERERENAAWNGKRGFCVCVKVLCLLCSDIDRFMKSRSGDVARSEVKRNLCGNFGGETENIRM